MCANAVTPPNAAPLAALPAMPSSGPALRASRAASIACMRPLGPASRAVSRPLDTGVSRSARIAEICCLVSSSAASTCSSMDARASPAIAACISGSFCCSVSSAAWRCSSGRTSGNGSRSTESGLSSAERSDLYDFASCTRASDTPSMPLSAGLSSSLSDSAEKMGRFAERSSCRSRTWFAISARWFVRISSRLRFSAWMSAACAAFAFANSSLSPASSSPARSSGSPSIAARAPRAAASLSPASCRPRSNSLSPRRRRRRSPRRAARCSTRRRRRVRR